MKTLTFYSGKLWHSDKPFPVNEPITHAAPAGSSGVAKVMHSLKIDQWLSTAYEVVNPEVIPITLDGYSTRIKDGDQITLPDGYGIETAARHKWKEGTGMEFVRFVATITLPEKPENSAHGCPKCRTRDFNSCHSMYCPMRKESVVEPSESQEEDQIDLLSEILVDYKTWLDDPEAGMRDYENFQAAQLEKFTITRK